jgi:hypothetical protein
MIKKIILLTNLLVLTNGFMDEINKLSPIKSREINLIAKMAPQVVISQLENALENTSLLESEDDSEDEETNSQTKTMAKSETSTQMIAENEPQITTNHELETDFETSSQLNSELLITTDQELETSSQPNTWFESSD